MRIDAIITLTVASVLALAVPSTRAADFGARVVGVDGKPLVDDKGKTVELTVREAVVNALLGVFPSEQSLSGEEKLHRFELAKRVQSEHPGEFPAEDIALMKKLVNQYYPSPLVVPQVWSALERPATTDQVSREKKGDGR